MKRGPAPTLAGASGVVPAADGTLCSSISKPFALRQQLRALGRTADRPRGGDVWSPSWARAETPGPPRAWKGARDMTIPTHGGRAVAAEPIGEVRATTLPPHHPSRGARRRAAASGRRGATAPPRRPLAIVVALLVALAVLAAACGSASDTTAGQPRTLSVFAAASLTDAFTQLGSDFTAAHPEVKVSLNFAGSNDLVTQLQQGAPGDVLATADTSNMDAAGDLAGHAAGIRRQQARRRRGAGRPPAHHRPCRPGAQGPQGRAGGAGSTRRQVRPGGSRQGRRHRHARLPRSLREGRRHQGLTR